MSHAPLKYGFLGLSPRRDGRASLLTPGCVAERATCDPPPTVVATGQRPLDGRDEKSMAWGRGRGDKSGVWLRLDGDTCRVLN